MEGGGARAALGRASGVRLAAGRSESRLPDITVPAAKSRRKKSHVCVYVLQQVHPHCYTDELQ